MLVRKVAPITNYSKVENNLWSDPRISDGARTLFGYLNSLRVGANFTDTYIMKALRISKRSLIRRRKELKDCNLITLDQVSARMYVVYIGHHQFTADMVKQHWINIEDDSPEDDEGLR